MLEDLHAPIQDAFGWTDSHLWEFTRSRSGACIAVPSSADADWRARERPPEAANVPIDAVFASAKAATCRYVYDLGERWAHEVVGKRTELPERFERATCLRVRAPAHPSTAAANLASRRAATSS